MPQGLTLQQLQAMGAKSVQKQGFTLEQLKSQNAFPTEAPPEVHKSFFEKLKSVTSTVGNALTSSEQTLGRGLSTVGSNIPQQQADQTAQNSQNVTKILALYHTATDPVQKEHLSNTLKAMASDPTAEEINPAFGLSNKQVIGAALGTALDVASAGSYGETSSGTKFLPEAGNILGDSGKLTKTTNAVAKTAGKTIEQIATDATIKKTTGQYAAGIGKKVLQGVAQGYGYDVSGNLQANKDNVFKPGAGAAIGGGIPLAVEATKGLGYIAKQVAKYTASGLSGTSVAAIEEGFKNPEQVQNAIRKAAADPENSAQQILSNAQSAMDTIKQARQKAYEINLEKLQNETTYTKAGKLYVKRVLSEAEAKGLKGYVPGTKIGVPTDLSTLGVKQVFTRTLKDFGAEGAGKALDYTNVALDDAHLTKLDQLQQRVYNWTDTTPQGINRLRQVIDSYKVGGINLGSSESKFNKIIGDLRTNLSDYLGKRVPQIEELNSQFAAESNVIDNINAQLKLNATDPNTALRKLLNVFNPKSVVYKPIVQQLGEKGSQNLMADIAGLTMSKWTPEGLAKYFDLVGGGALAMLKPETLLAAPLAMPRVVGETTTSLGKIAQNKTAQEIGRKAVSAGKVVGKLITRKAGLSK